jgi:hypothetical protein
VGAIAEQEEFVEMLVKNYSGGMYVRSAFAVAGRLSRERRRPGASRLREASRCP